MRFLAYLQLSFHHPELVRVLELGQTFLDQRESLRKRIKGPLQLGRFHVHSAGGARSNRGQRKAAKPASGSILSGPCQKPSSPGELVVLRLELDRSQPDLLRIGICLIRVNFGQAFYPGENLSDLKSKREDGSGSGHISRHPLGLGAHQPQDLSLGTLLHRLLQQSLQTLTGPMRLLKVGRRQPD